MHVVGGDTLDTGTSCDLHECIVACRVEGIVVIPQFDGDVVVPEQRDEVSERATRRRRPIAHQRARHHPLAATGQHHPMTVVRLRELGEVVEGLALLLASHLRRADHAREPRVADRVASQHEEVVALRIGGPVLRFAQPEAELGAEHGRQPDLTSGLSKPHDAVEAVVIGDGQRFEPEAGGLLGQLLGMRRTIEKGEVRVAVQLGVGH